MCVGCEPCHVLDKAQYRYVHLLLLEHGYALACVGQRHLLGRGHDHYAGQRQCLNQGQMYVACAGRHVDKEIVQLAPPRVGDELLQGVAGHAAAPQHRLVLVDHETDGQQLHTVFLDRLDPVAPLLVDHVYGFVFHAEHLGHRGTEYIGVKQAYLITGCRQGHS